MKSQLPNLRRLVNGLVLTAVLLAMPVILAAQEKIVFSSNREGAGNDEVYVMNTNGSDQKRLTFNTKFDGEASFSAERRVRQTSGISTV